VKKGRKNKKDKEKRNKEEKQRTVSRPPPRSEAAGRGLSMYQFSERTS